jgi:hypothetical protein
VTAEHLRLTGGGSVPHKGTGYLAVTWPFVQIVFSEEHVALEFRWSWVKGIARAVSFGRNEGRDALVWWDANAAEITKVKISERRTSYIFESTAGDCSFGLPRHVGSVSAKCDQIECEIDRLGLRRESVASNFWTRGQMRSVR